MQNVLSYYDVAYDQSVELYEEAYNFVIKIYECIIFKNNDLYMICIMHLMMVLFEQI